MKDFHHHWTTKHHYLADTVSGCYERGEDEDEALRGAVAAMPLVLLRLAVTTYRYLRLRSRPSSRVQLRIRCRLPTRGTAASLHQTWRHASAPGLLDLDNNSSQKQHHSDRRLLAPTPLGNQ